MYDVFLTEKKFFFSWESNGSVGSKINFSHYIDKSPLRWYFYRLHVIEAFFFLVFFIFVKI